MPRKRRKKRKKSVSLPIGIMREPSLSGFPIIHKNINQLWRWDTLEDVKF